VVYEWFRKEPPWIALLVFVGTLFFIAIVAGLSIFTDFNFVNAYPLFDVLFVVMVFALFAGCVWKIKRLDFPNFLMLFGIASLAISLLLDMLSAHNIIDWIGRAGQWGLVFFTLSSLGIYMFYYWRQQIALRALTDALEEQVEQRTSELVASQKNLELAARQDYLTRLLNRRAFMDSALSEVANAKRYQRKLSMILFDIDWFKQVNDEYGHGCGDQVLKLVASSLEQQSREGDLLCRYGGEEFVVMLHATDLEEASIFAERLRKAIKNIEVPTEKDVIKVTGSFGVVAIDVATLDNLDTQYILDSMIKRADDAMYEVKEDGRDGTKAYKI